MARPAKGARLHKFNHRPNWFIRDTGKPDVSTGTPDRAAAEEALRRYIASEERSALRDSISTDEKAMSAIRKIMRKTRERAAAKGFACEITLNHLSEIYSAQGGRCALTGISFSTEKSTDGRRQPFAPSADRIRNSDGYTRDNVRLVCAIANLARGDFSDEEFLMMCRGAASLNA